MFNGATAGLQAAQLPGQLRGAGDQGAARTIDMIRRLPLMDKFKFLASSDEQFLAHLAKTQPQIAQNYAALMRGDPGLLSTVRASLTGGTLA